MHGGENPPVTPTKPATNTNGILIRTGVLPSIDQNIPALTKPYDVPGGRTLYGPGNMPPEVTDPDAKKTADLLQKNDEPGKSFKVYDKTAEALLTEMLTIQKGNPGQKDAAYRAGANAGDVSGVYASIDTENLDKSIQRFSTDIVALAKTLDSPMTLEVSGEVVVNVKLNGAEWLAGAMDSIGRYVGHKVTGGINNFIRKGLRDTRITTKTKWDDDDTSDQTMAGNNSSGSM